MMCDACDGEFHLRCMSLEAAPKGEWACPGCLADEKEFKNLKYLVIGQKPTDFTLPRKRKKDKVVVCYSPSKPLEIAWEECVEKGFMCVSKVFSHDIIRILTHGTLERRTSSGRVADVWYGAIEEVRYEHT